jgi:hypothetical protein
MVIKAIRRITIAQVIIAIKAPFEILNVLELAVACPVPAVPKLPLPVPGTTPAAVLPETVVKIVVRYPFFIVLVMVTAAAGCTTAVATPVASI